MCMCVFYRGTKKEMHKNRSRSEERKTVGERCQFKRGRDTIAVCINLPSLASMSPFNFQLFKPSH